MAENPYLVPLIAFGFILFCNVLGLIYSFSNTNQNNLSKGKCMNDNNANKKHNYSCFIWDSSQSKCLDGMYDSNLVCVPLSTDMSPWQKIAIIISVIAFFVYFVLYKNHKNHK